MMMSRKIAKIRGNVLFIILVAVMIFAALTAAVTRSNQGSQSLDRERGTISASDVLAYGAAMEKVIARMLADGTMSESAISFENNIWQFNNGDPTSPAALYTNCTTDACKVFHPAGGGLSAQTFGSQNLPSPAATEVKSGHGAVWSIDVQGVGTAARDLVLVIATIDPNTCTAINSLLKIDNPSGFPPMDNWSSAVRYNGTFGGPSYDPEDPTPPDTTAAIGDLATSLQGKTAGCVRRSGGAYGDRDNYFYQVLLPR